MRPHVLWQDCWCHVAPHGSEEQRDEFLRHMQAKSDKKLVVMPDRMIVYELKKLLKEV